MIRRKSWTRLCGDWGCRPGELTQANYGTAVNRITSIRRGDRAFSRNHPPLPSRRPIRHRCEGNKSSLRPRGGNQQRPEMSWQIFLCTFAILAIVRALLVPGLAPKPAACGSRVSASRLELDWRLMISNTLEFRVLHHRSLGRPAVCFRAVVACRSLFLAWVYASAMQPP